MYKSLNVYCIKGVSYNRRVENYKLQLLKNRFEMIYLVMLNNFHNKKSNEQIRYGNKQFDEQMRCKKLSEKMKIIVDRRKVINMEFMLYEMEWCDDVDDVDNDLCEVDE